MFERLILGTAQVGQQYGIAQSRGFVTVAEVSTVLHAARVAGITTLDTAIRYGNSETLLGQAGAASWQVISKLGKLPANCTDIATWVDIQISQSIRRLRVPRLAGFLLHSPSQLFEIFGPDLWSALLRIKRKGLVEKIGYSIYQPSELDSLIYAFPPDLVQAPYNILDRQLAFSGWIDKLASLGVELHVRSIFLQGLLLLPSSLRPKYFSRWRHIWSIWDDWLLSNNLTPVQGALSFALSNSGNFKIVIGIDSLGQLNEILSVTELDHISFPDQLSVSDPLLINPTHWHIS